MRIPRSALRTPVTVEPWLGNTGDGDTWGPAVPELARVDLTERVQRGPTGDTRVTAGRLILAPDTTVAAHDRVTVDGTTYRVGTVKPVHDPGSRVFHVEAVLL